MDSRIQEIIVNINTASQFMPDIAIVIWSILISLEEFGGLGEPENRVLLAHSSSTGAHLHHAHLTPFIHPEVDLPNLTQARNERSRPVFYLSHEQPTVAETTYPPSLKKRLN